MPGYYAYQLCILFDYFTPHHDLIKDVKWFRICFGRIYFFRLLKSRGYEFMPLLDSPDCENPLRLHTVLHHSHIMSLEKSPGRKSSLGKLSLQRETVEGKSSPTRKRLIETRRGKRVVWRGLGGVPIFSLVWVKWKTSDSFRSFAYGLLSAVFLFCSQALSLGCVINWKRKLKFSRLTQFFKYLLFVAEWREMILPGDILYNLSSYQQYSNFSQEWFELFVAQY